jgi:hypothetical protein
VHAFTEPEKASWFTAQREYVQVNRPYQYFLWAFSISQNRQRESRCSTATEVRLVCFCISNIQARQMIIISRLQDLRWDCIAIERPAERYASHLCQELASRHSQLHIAQMPSERPHWFISAITAFVFRPATPQMFYQSFLDIAGFIEYFLTLHFDADIILPDYWWAITIYFSTLASSFDFR